MENLLVQKLRAYVANFNPQALHQTVQPALTKSSKDEIKEIMSIFKGI
jgi:hypothetical protein